MSLFGKITARNKIRKASRELAWDPSARNYIALAREHVAAGNTETVLRICKEGLEVHPGDADLKRFADRALQLKLETRIRALQQDLKVSPRPALWREMCDLLLVSGKRGKASKVATEWNRVSKDGESLFYRARVCAEIFFADRSAVDGRQAFKFAKEAQKLLRGDPRPLELQLEIASRCGAWHEARRCIARL